LFAENNDLYTARARWSDLIQRRGGAGNSLDAKRSAVAAAAARGAAAGID